MSQQPKTDSSDQPLRGRDLELYLSHPAVGAGLPLWLPDGAILRSELERLVAEEARRGGCERVQTPVLAKRELFERSGHWDKFADDMFPPMIVGGEEFVLRPANCPHHNLIYASRQRSFRDLPVRLSEIGAMFRSERSGVLSGLSRVRQINLDDCHVYCTPEQLEDEIARGLEAIERCYRLLGIEIAYYRLSLGGGPASGLGSAEIWQRAEAALAAALRRLDLPYVEAPGEAAFYGPKIDVQVRDSAGREESLSTVQCDFVQPERFGLEYVGSDGARHRPVLVHRGVLSSMERMTAKLIDLYQGIFPPWLSPRQVLVLPVGAEQEDAARALASRCREAGVRAEVEPAESSLAARVARAGRRVPYLAVLGAREVVAGSVALRLSDGQRLPGVAQDDFVAGVTRVVARRAHGPGLAAGTDRRPGGGS